MSFLLYMEEIIIYSEIPNIWCAITIFWEQDYHLIESFKIEPEANTNIGFPWIDVYKKLKKNNSERILLVKNNVLINYGQEAHKFFNLNYSISYSLSTNLQRTIIKAGPAADEMFFMYAKHLIKYHHWHDKRITFLHSILVLILVVTKMIKTWRSTFVKVIKKNPQTLV